MGEHTCRTCGYVNAHISFFHNRQPCENCGETCKDIRCDSCDLA
jgi:hypothetical protein